MRRKAASEKILKRFMRDDNKNRQLLSAVEPSASGWRVRVCVMRCQTPHQYNHHDDDDQPHDAGEGDEVEGDGEGEIRLQEHVDPAGQTQQHECPCEFLHLQ